MTRYASRTLRALELLAREPASAPELADALAVDVRTARTLLGALAADGYVARGPRRRWRATGRFESLAADARSRIVPRPMKLYEHDSSGNCLKVRILLRQLELPYESVSVDLFRGETRTPEHFARNPDGRIPVLETDDGDLIPESGAILLYLADGTPFLPPPGVGRARVHQWMFFEQNRIEADLAVARFLKLAGRDATMPEVFANRLERGRDALATLDRALADGRPFLAGDAYSVADIAVYGYGHCGADAGADPRDFDHVGAWLDRVEATPGFINDLAPVPAHVSERPI
ncbi:MAG TPA: glutathione S-transferase N-terminal domain-containing protein [Solirubrobacteraceae bacterium]